MVALAAMLPAALAGCATLLPPQNPDTDARLLRGAVTVPAPNGFCVDEEASNPSEGFAIMAPCSAVSGAGSAPSNAAIITIQAGVAGTAAVSGAEDALVALLESREGASLLATSDTAGGVVVSSTAQGENDVRVAFEELDAASIAGTTGTVRRAFFDVGIHLVTISVRSLKVAPLSGRAGRSLLIDLVTATKQANAATAAENS